MTPLDLVKLTALMERTSGRGDVIIGLLDGPVAMTHPDLVGASMHANMNLLMSEYEGRDNWTATAGFGFADSIQESNKQAGG